MPNEQDRKPYLLTQHDGEQFILMCFAYPHAINKARQMWFDHKYLREITPDEDAFGRLSAHIKGELPQARGHSPVYLVDPKNPLPATLGVEPEEETEDNNQQATVSHTLDRVYRVKVKQDGHRWKAWTTVWTEKVPEDTATVGQESAEVVTYSSEAFFAYLNVKAALDSMGVRGYIEPEFIHREADGSLHVGVGFYGMRPDRERMPLKANGG